MKDMEAVCSHYGTVVVLMGTFFLKSLVVPKTYRTFVAE